MLIKTLGLKGVFSEHVALQNNKKLLTAYNPLICVCMYQSSHLLLYEIKPFIYVFLLLITYETAKKRITYMQTDIHNIKKRIKAQNIMEK